MRVPANSILHMMGTVIVPGVVTTTVRMGIFIDEPTAAALVGPLRVSGGNVAVPRSMVWRHAGGVSFSPP